MLTVNGGTVTDFLFAGLTGVIPGDMLLRVNDEAVLGRPHRDVVKMFEHVAPGQTAALQLLRGYPLPADAEEDTQQNNIPKVSDCF